MARNPSASIKTRWLGKRLRDLREQRDITQPEAAEYIGRSKAMVSRIEGGTMTPTSDDLDGLLKLFQLEPAHRDALIRFHQAEPTATWLDAYADPDDATRVDYVWLEQQSLEVRSFCAIVIDGLLQTPDYAREVIRAAGPQLTDAQVDHWVELRLTRQNMLSRSDPPKLLAVLDEAVLTRQVGGRQVMAAQLRHLATQAQRPNIELQVLPASVGAHASPDTSFRIHSLPEPLADVVSIDVAGGLLYVEPPKTDVYFTRYEALHRQALDPANSIDVLAKLAGTMEQT